jgi:hypothetical protein
MKYNFGKEVTDTSPKCIADPSEMHPLARRDRLGKQPLLSHRPLGR